MSDSNFTYTKQDSFVECGDILFLRLSQRVYKGLKEIRMAAFEKHALETLMILKDAILTSREIYRLAEGGYASADYNPDSVVWTIINRLRKKLGDEYIQLVEDKGYSFVGNNSLWAKSDFEPSAESFIDYAGVLINPSYRLIFNGSKPVTVRPRDYDVLDVLIHNSERVLSRSDIGKMIPHKQDEPDNLSPDNMHGIISRLRKNIGDKRCIRSIGYRGYQFVGRNGAESAPAVT